MCVHQPQCSPTTLIGDDRITAGDEMMTIYHILSIEAEKLHKHDYLAFKGPLSVEPSARNANPRQDDGETPHRVASSFSAIRQAQDIP